MTRLVLSMALTLGLAGCAPMTGLSEACQRDYDACLNGCPNPPPGSDLQPEVARCTAQCNELAKRCK
jgi:hypothetical protein